ncbi:MAG: hypothetical protein OEY79_03430 [Anaplasmataceae bacterium]|nr:hypothetical protein [Anaplasmataceae bacterium]
MKLAIDNLALYVPIGAYEWEKGVKQKLILNLNYNIDDGEGFFILDYQNIIDYIIVHSNERTEYLEDYLIYLKNKIIDLFKLHNLTTTNGTIAITKCFIGSAHTVTVEDNFSL